MFALILSEEDVDASKVIEMLLIHDIVEVDTGDTPIHGAFDVAALENAEHEAAKRLFGLLPPDQARRLLCIWKEFEAAASSEARFAKALDRLQPLLLNTLTDGGTWLENDVSEDQVLDRYGPTISSGSPKLWAYALELVERFYAQKRIV